MNWNFSLPVMPLRLACIALFASLLLSGKVCAQDAEPIWEEVLSREHSVLASVEESGHVFKELASREHSVLMVAENSGTSITEISSREYSVLAVAENPGTSIAEVSSREHSVLTVDENPAVTFQNLVSREFSVLAVQENPGAGSSEISSREYSMYFANPNLPPRVTPENAHLLASTSVTAYGSVNLSWADYPEAAKAMVSRFKVYAADKAFGSVLGMEPVAEVARGKLDATLAGLRGGVTYFFAVVAQDQVGNFEAVVTPVTAVSSVSAVGEVEQLTASSGDALLEYSWRAAAGTEPFLVAYKAYFNGAGAVSLAPNVNHWSRTGIASGPVYRLKLTTVDVFGNESRGVTIDGTPWLANPTGVGITVEGGQFRLFWDPITPTVAVKHYAIFQSNRAFDTVGDLTPVFTTTESTQVLGPDFALRGLHFGVAVVNATGGMNSSVRSIEATKVSQLIDFPPAVVSGRTVILAATASSGLPVSFAASPSAIGQIVGKVLTPNRGGKVRLVARQAGNDQFWPAESSQVVRVPPVVSHLTIDGNNVAGQTVTTDGTLGLTALDTEGIARVGFFGRAPGAEWSLLASDQTPGDGFSARLELASKPFGAFEIRAVAVAMDSVESEISGRLILDGAATLSLVLEADHGTEGGIVHGTVNIQSPRPAPLSISFSTSHTSQVLPSGPVSIPAGQTSAPFYFRLSQDSEIEAPLEATISASAQNALEASAKVTVYDDDWPMLTLKLSRSVVPESAGENAVVARVERDIISDRAVRVYLTNSNPATARVPSFVDIQKNKASVEFPIGVIDDQEVDGPQIASIVGEVKLTDYGTVIQTLPARLEVGDDEAAVLELTSRRHYVLEGGTRLVTLRRLKSDVSVPLGVTLFADEAGELRTPSIVEIPAGATSLDFQVQGINDGRDDDDKTVLITASAPGHGPSELRMLVTGNPQPDLLLAQVESPATVDTEAELRINYTIRNDGEGSPGRSFSTSFFLSADQVLDDEDLFLAEYEFEGVLDKDSSFSSTAIAHAPRRPGKWWLIGVTDELRQVPELIESNNQLVAQPITVVPSYSATVEELTRLVPANTPVAITGFAVNAAGDIVPRVPVYIRIRTGNSERTVGAVTDDDGAYNVSWYPLQDEFGEYEVSASHPGVSGSPTQATFSIIKLASNFQRTQVSIDEGASDTVLGEISNPTTHRLTGLTVSVAAPSPGLTVRVSLPTSELEPGQRSSIGVDVVATNGFHGSETILVTITSAQGVTLTIPITVNIRQLLPNLIVTPGKLECSAVRGRQKNINLEIQNTGGAESGPIDLLLPSLPWMKLASQGQVASIPAGGSATVSLILAPSTAQAVTLYNGTIIIDALRADPLNLPFGIRVVSDRKGDLEVEVVDEFFFFSDTDQKVEGASVVLRDAITSEQLRRADTPAAGKATFSGIDEGWYTVEIDSPKHTRWRGNFYVDAGEVNKEQIFVSRETVTYTWNVEEVEIKDRYKISIESTFETNVPVPVVTVTPGVLDLSGLDELGDTKVINFKVENHGFIGADRGRFNFGSHPFYKITPLVSTIARIPAKTVVEIPVEVVRVGKYGPNGEYLRLAQQADAKAADAKQTKSTSAAGFSPAIIADCYLSGNFEWEYLCGVIPVPKIIPIPGSEVDGDCPEPPIFDPWLPPTDPVDLPDPPVIDREPQDTRPVRWVDQPFYIPTSQPTYGGGSGNSGGHSNVVRTNNPTGTGQPTVTPVDHQPPTVCDCEIFDKRCIKLTLENKFEGLTDKLKSAVLSVVNKFPIPLEILKVDVKWVIDGEACTCCIEDQLSLKGKASATGKIKIILGVLGDKGEHKGIPMPTGPEGSTIDIEYDYAGLGRVTVEGQVKVELEKTCEGDWRICGSGSASGRIDIGPTLRGKAKWKQGIVLIGEGEIRGRIALSGSISVSFSVCNDEPLKITACGSLSAAAEIEGEIQVKTGVTLVSGVIEPGTYPFSFGWTLFNYEGCTPLVGGKSALAKASVSKKNAGKPSAPQLPETKFIYDEPVVVTVPQSELVPTDAEIWAAMDLKRPTGGVCARVKIRIDQEAVMTRSAFRATLQLANGESGSDLTNVGFAMDIRDANGAAADNVFNSRVFRLQGLNAIDGTGTIPQKSSGAVEWELIPRDTAAPLKDTPYFIGGTIFYRQDGAIFSIRVEPVRITVKPDASLTLKYFHERDVFADDPHTPLIESSKPFGLAVMVENNGAGIANDLVITSAQPKIVENEKGLLIDFEILSTEVSGHGIRPSLTAHFGDLQPGEREVAIWRLKSSLQGLFTDYSATFEHLDGFGDPRLSLIKNVEIHEMVKMIKGEGPGFDTQPDFLVNDQADIDDFPDTIHFSEGGTAPVVLRQTASVTGQVTNQSRTIQVDTGAFTGWSYIRLLEPTNGRFKLISVVRSDGTVLTVDTNAWVTDRTFVGLGSRPISENILHLADHDSTGRYSLTYEPWPNADVIPPVSRVAALETETSQSIPVRWDGTDSGGIQNFDIYVKVDSQPWTLWLNDTTRRSAVYEAEPDRNYAFYSIASDGAGNLERKNGEPDATTRTAKQNLAPKLLPIGNQFISEGSSLSLPISATDPDGPLGDLTVQVTSPTAGVVYDASSGRIRWVTSETDGGTTTSATVTVTDRGRPARSASEVFTITVQEVNRPPRLTAIPPLTVPQGTMMQATAHAEDSDVPGQSIVYSLGAVSPATAVINSHSGVITWAPSQSDRGKTHVFEVIATDNGAAPLADVLLFTATVTATPSPVNSVPSVSLISPAPGITHRAPTAVTLLAAATDPGGSVAKVEFYVDNAKVGEDTDPPYSSQTAELPAGTYAVTAKATDNLGASSISGPLTLSVSNAPNSVPSVVIAAPVDGMATENSSVKIEAEGTDTDGNVNRVEFFNGSTKLGEDNTAPFTFIWVGVEVGTYDLTAVATDNEGGKRTSPAVSVTFKPAGNFFGSYSENFDSLGTDGTVLPGTWTIQNGASGTGDRTWMNSISDVEVARMTKSASPLTPVAVPSSPSDSAFNTAAGAASPSNRAVATSPASNAGTALQLLLKNETGLPVNAISLGYDSIYFSSLVPGAELPGYWVFYSLDDGATWTNATEFNPAVGAASTTGVVTTAPTSLTLSKTWDAGSRLLLRWVDDNASGDLAEPILGLDNVTVTATPVPPSLRLNSPTEGSIVKSPVTVSFDVAKVAPPGSPRLRFGSNEMALVPALLALGSHEFSFNPANPTATAEIQIGGAVPDGDYPVTLDYINAFGVTIASASLNRVSIDTAPPLITAPANVSILATSRSGAVVNYPPATATGASTITYSHPTGRTFPIGLTSVTATAADEAGNTATAQFDVIVTTRRVDASIIAPVEGTVVRATTSSLKVEGSADALATSVTVSINGGPAIPTTLLPGTAGRKKWSTTLSASSALSGGFNNLVASASDGIGTTSSAPRNVFYEVFKPVSFSSAPANAGSIAFNPRLGTGNTAAVGRKYTATAKAVAGYFFRAWGGKTAGTSPSSDFVFAEGDLIEAQFMETPFTKEIAGTYNCALSGPTQTSSGLFTLQLNPVTGTFTAKTILDGNAVPFTGAFDPINFQYSGAQAALALDTKNRRITGTLVASPAHVNAPRAHDKLAPVTGAFYNLAFTVPTPPPGLFPDQYPPGSGTGVLNLTASGGALITGYLADGTAYSSATLLGLDETLPIVAFCRTAAKSPPFAALVGTAAIDPNNAKTDVTASGIRWFRTANASQYYPRGYDSGLNVDIVGALRSTSTKASLGLGLAPTLTFSAGSFPTPVDVPLSSSLTTPNRLTRLAISAYGLIDGDYRTTSTSAKYQIRGIIVGKAGVGRAYGYILTPAPTIINGNGQSGLIDLHP